VKLVSLPLLAALVFAVCGGLAATSMQIVLREIAIEGGVNRWVFISVPGLFAALFAMIVYQGAEQRMKTVGQSISRGILVALLTWAGFSALATAVWFPLEDFLRWFSTTMLVCGVVGGGPMLLAALVAGAIVGTVAKQRGKSWLMKS
jgi:hypothetical protein